MTAGRRKRVSSVRLTLTVLGLLAAPALAAEPITGRPSVTDGDTLVIRNTRIRLHGIDAPESAQTCQDKAGKDYRCGQAAALALDSHIGHATVTCEPRDTDQYGRTVSVCRKGPEDLNAWMVTQ
ncbi:thermonuclease family protein, partial [Methylobacterium hispanicum]